MKNEKYSFGDFTDKSFKDQPVGDFNNTTIKGSCFYQQYHVDCDIFPAGMTGVTFENCNLDNVLIPRGNTVVGGCNRNIRVQNDGNDWVLDDTLKPIEPVSKKGMVSEGKNIDPRNLPAKYELEIEVDSEDYTKNYQNTLTDNTYFKTNPQVVSTKDTRQAAIVNQADFDLMSQGGNLGRFKQLPTKITPATPLPKGKVLVEGLVTMHVIHGEAYKFKDKDGSMY